ncbi:hypothetical protein QR98_0025510 [Sarcoptes scabiei]|nr:hypothetical protein QR98_0025510 [Sarcoptes scabiei]
MNGKRMMSVRYSPSSNETTNLELIYNLNPCDSKQYLNSVFNGPRTKEFFNPIKDNSHSQAKANLKQRQENEMFTALIEERAKQEAQLRELKGYEASAKYQPPLIDANFTTALALATPNGTILANPYNSNLGYAFDDQSHKRSCAQWRMTLFVFYWIIWIVFLIGVVIIVAANTRTD